MASTLDARNLWERRLWGNNPGAGNERQVDWDQYADGTADGGGLMHREGQRVLCGLFLNKSFQSSLSTGLAGPRLVSRGRLWLCCLTAISFELRNFQRLYDMAGGS